MPSSAPSIREVSLSHWKRSSFAVFLRAEVLKRLLSLPRRARRRLLSLSPAPRSSSQAPLSPYDERWAMTLRDFCCLYGLVGYHARLERLGFLSVASLRTACNMYLLKPQGYGSPGRRNDNKPIPRGFSQSEIDRLFAAVTLWEDGRDRDGERIGRRQSRWRGPSAGRPSREHDGELSPFNRHPLFFTTSRISLGLSSLSSLSLLSLLSLSPFSFALVPAFLHFVRLYTQKRPRSSNLTVNPSLQDRNMEANFEPKSEAQDAPRSVLSRAHLYVGNLSPRVTEYMLTEIFAVAGPVQNVKIIPDRNYQHGGLNYGFVEYRDMRAAETALQTLNGRKIFDTEIKVNWAYQGQQNKEDTQGHFHVFVGDLSPEVNDEVLQKAFGAFGTLSDARVMWDMSSGKSRGYGFLAFREKADAEQAIATMNGEWLGSRAIRVNWANQKTQTGGSGGGGSSGMAGGAVGGGVSMGMGVPRPGGMGGAPAPVNFQGGPLSYDVVVAQTPAINTTVYVGNLIPYATQADLIPLFQGYGYIVEIRMQADRGFAFVKLDSHENAAMAIVQLQGQLVHGRPVKCSWGKDRMSTSGEGAQPGGGMSGGMSGGQPGGVAAGYGMPQGMYGQMPPNAYAQYPFAAAGYAGFPQPGAGVGGGADVQDPAMAAAQQAYYQQALAAQQMQAAAAAGGQAGGAGWGDFYGAQAQQQQGQAPQQQPPQ